MPRSKLNLNPDRDTLFTQFFRSGCMKEAFPFDFILVQAPRGMACDIVKKIHNLNPDELICYQHESTNFIVTEDVELENHWLFKPEQPGNHCIELIKWDAVPYYLSGAFVGRNWKLVED